MGEISRSGGERFVFVADGADDGSLRFVEQDVGVVERF